MRNFLIIAILFVLILAGLSESNTVENVPPEETVNMDEKSIEKAVEKLLDEMTIEEKIGQMIMAGIEGEDIADDSRILLTEYHIGGIILFDRNMKDPEQVKNLITHLKEASEEKMPIFIATDEEGGENARLKTFIASPPAAKLLADSGNVDKTYEDMKTAAAAFKELGFNMNFAPVADLNLPKNRAYSSDANITGKFVKSAAKGVYDGGLIPVVKHFPGFGSVNVEGGRFVVNKKKADLAATDLYPYQVLKEAEFPYFVMVNNAVYKDIDKEPASMSRAIIKNLLRGDLNYQGVVITDDLSTGGVYTPAERALKAIEAGADIILSAGKYENTRAMCAAIVEAYKHDKISLSRINDSARRILKAKIVMKNSGGKQ